MAVVALDGLFGCTHVEVAGLEDKLQLVDGGGKGKLVDELHIELDRLVFGLVTTPGAAVGDDLAVALLEDDGGMASLDDGCGVVARRLADGFDIELVADEGTQRHGYGQTYHARSGNTYAHGVFQDVGTQKERDALGLAAQYLCGTSHTQGYCHGLGAAHCRHHFARHECQYLLSYTIVYHNVCICCRIVGLQSADGLEQLVAHADGVAMALEDHAVEGVADDKEGQRRCVGKPHALA